MLGAITFTQKEIVFLFLLGGQHVHKYKRLKKQKYLRHVLWSLPAGPITPFRHYCVHEMFSYVSVHPTFIDANIYNALLESSIYKNQTYECFE